MCKDTDTRYSEKFMEWVIDRLVPFHVLLKSDACIHSEDPYFPVDEGTCFCPFHDNSNTKAAKLYSGNGTGQTLYCFAEQRMFRPHHLLSKGIVEIRLEKLFENIWGQIDPTVQAKLVAESGENSNAIPTLKDYSTLYEKYRNGEITLESVAFGMLDSGSFEDKKP